MDLVVVLLWCYIVKINYKKNSCVKILPRHMDIKVDTISVRHFVLTKRSANLMKLDIETVTIHATLESTVIRPHCKA